MSRPTPPAGPYGRRLGHDAREARDRRGFHIPPCVHDGTERPIQRPQDPEEQQEYDSGKKKCHTLKNLLLIDESCHMCFLTHTCEGKASDKSLAEEASYTLPAGSCLYQDKGFQGFVLEGITIAGGFTDKAAPGRVRVIRSTGGGQQVISVDMNDIIKRGQRAKAMMLQENDVVVVPESFF